MKLEKRVINYEPVDINANDLLTVKEAAEMLSTTTVNLAHAIERGRFTEIRDANAQDRRYNRRYLLRAEIEAAK